jgi:regulatory protein
MSKTDIYKSALNKAMRLCSGREYCIRDIREKAGSWNIENADTDRLIKTLLEEKFIDESRYSTAYARDKFKYNKWGKIKISAALRNKGIPHALIIQATSALDENLYRETLIKLLATHRKTGKAKDEYELKSKLLRFGLSRGFESALMYEILGEEV